MVTGAGSGIGRAGAAMMAREGAHVVIVDRDAEGGADALRRQSGRKGIGPRPTPSTSPTTRRSASLVSDMLARLGRIDILHNHAGAQVAGRP